MEMSTCNAVVKRETKRERESELEMGTEGESEIIIREKERCCLRVSIYGMAGLSCLEISIYGLA